MLVDKSLRSNLLSWIEVIAKMQDSHSFDPRAWSCFRILVADKRSESTTTSVFEEVASDTESKNSAMMLHPKGEVVTCGKEDGTVALYDLKTIAQLGMLYRHKSLVRILCW